MPEVGLEPTRPCGHGILSPARLPVSPFRPEAAKSTLLACEHGAGKVFHPRDIFRPSVPILRGKLWRTRGFPGFSHRVGWHAFCLLPGGDDKNGEEMAHLTEILAEPRFMQLVLVALSVGLATIARKG